MIAENLPAKGYSNDSGSLLEEVNIFTLWMGKKNLHFRNFVSLKNKQNKTGCETGQPNRFLLRTKYQTSIMAVLQFFFPQWPLTVLQPKIPFGPKSICPISCITKAIATLLRAVSLLVLMPHGRCRGTMGSDTSSSILS